MQDKETIEKAVTETTEWLDANQAAEKDEYEVQLNSISIQFQSDLIRHIRGTGEAKRA